MKTETRCRPAAPWLALGLVALCGLAQAGTAPKHVDPLRLQYERDKAACISGHTSEPRNVCLREAAAAYAEARRGRLAEAGAGPEVWAANALKRCEVQPQEERKTCERRVSEGQVSGSVESGGQLTTLTIRSTDIPKTPGG